MAPRRLQAAEYTVGWVCALPIELAAAQTILDEEHEKLPQDSLDSNLYTLGCIGSHNVVLLCLPAGRMGTSPAAAGATRMLTRFESIRLGLLVGVGGGVPSAETDIRLGDVVISQPYKQHGGVVQYDFGKTGRDGHRTRTGFLNSPPKVLLSAVSQLQANWYRKQSNLAAHLALFDQLPKFRRETAGPDILFEGDYNHDGKASCEGCDREKVIQRKVRRSGEEVTIHYGTIASGNQVIKDGATRDRLSAELGGVLCFEMEAAGLMNDFPCLVIRGICDYADSHKNKAWQPYAAATAAAYTKEILSSIPTPEMTVTATDITSTFRPKEWKYETICNTSLLLSLEPNHGTNELVGDLLRQITIHPTRTKEPQAIMYRANNQNEDQRKATYRSQGSTRESKTGHNRHTVGPRPCIQKLPISDYQQAGSACKAGCICRCHAPRHFRILPHSQFLGSFSITVSAASGNKSLCTETSCSRRLISIARATYRFPYWFVARILYLTVSIQPRSGLNTSLIMPRVVPDNADIMHFAKKGCVNGVKDLFEQNLASPCDVNATWNVPVLSYAVQGHHTELCQLLLNEGADPYIANLSNVSPLDRAWDIVLAQSAAIEIETKLRMIFSLHYDSIWFEDQQFTILHKIVFRSVGQDLRTQLQLSTSAINQADSKGRTPLAWASLRGDEQCVQTLLDFGADPNISCATGNSPLLRSVRARSSGCVRLLLEHGADIGLKSNLGFTALHYAAYYKNDEAYLTPLLDFGAQVNEKDDYGWTALAATAEYDHERSANELINRGADIETRDKDGWTPLLRAINSNSHGVLKLLLRRRANLLAISFRNETILHFAANRGDYETLNILAKVSLGHLDSDIRDSKGQRAMDIMSIRSPQPSRLFDAFNILVETLRRKC